MLDPTPILDTLVEIFQNIPALVAALDDNGANIQAHHGYYGLEPPLEKAIYAMTAPSILLCFDSRLGGNFDGMTLFKYKFEAYLRVGNQADAPNPISHQTLWTLMMNSGPVQAFDATSAPNIRYAQIHPRLTLMDTPPDVRLLDTEREDYRVGTMVFPELGDQSD